MAIVIEDVQIERLAQTIASAEGLSVAEVVRESLLSLAREVDAVPARTPADMRSDDEILGYDEHGAW